MTEEELELLEESLLEEFDNMNEELTTEELLEQFSESKKYFRLCLCYLMHELYEERYVECLIKSSKDEKENFHEFVEIQYKKFLCGFICRFTKASKTWVKKMYLSQFNLIFPVSDLPDEEFCNDKAVFEDDGIIEPNTVAILCSDTFAWACADDEVVKEHELDDVVEVSRYFGSDGQIAWIALKRGYEPADFYLEKYGENYYKAKAFLESKYESKTN